MNRGHLTWCATTGALGLLFTVLKIAGVISWSWLWVLSPIWGGALFVLLVPLLLMAGDAIFDRI